MFQFNLAERDLLWTFLMPNGAGKSCRAVNVHSNILWENERISSIKLHRREQNVMARHNFNGKWNRN
jgi:hypothetical protein